MQELDVLKLKITKIENADVYVAKGKGYKWINHLDKVISDGDVLDTRMGWQFYVVGTGNSIFKGSFRIETWVERGAGDQLLVPDSQKNNNNN